MQRDRRMGMSGFSRNGRFQIENSTTGPTATSIIKTGSKSVYRIFNSGSDAFKVKRAGSSNAGVTVAPQNSIDAEITGNLQVIVPKNKTAEGIYEFVESNVAVRTGRFRGRLSNSTNPAPALIHGREGSVYRIFNSGEHDFVVQYDNESATVPPRESHDFVVKGVVELLATSTSDVPIKAIYDYLDSSKAIRSGRFKKLPTTPATELKHEIINFTKYVNPSSGRVKPYMLYRIFNAGEAAIEVYAQSGSLAEVPLTTLEVGQSFDFGFNANGFGMQNCKAVWVRSTDNTVALKGMYDYLGTDE